MPHAQTISSDGTDIVIIEGHPYIFLISYLFVYSIDRQLISIHILSLTLGLLRFSTRGRRS